MATHSEDDNQPVSGPGDQSQQQQVEGSQQPTGEEARSHGSTGEGSGSAMARLISQEQARRVVPGTPDDAPDGSS